MNKANGCIVVTAVGLALIMASQLWPAMAAAGSDWDQEQASEYTAAAQQLHELSYGPHHAGHTDRSATSPGETDAAQLSAARARFDAARTTLEQARSWRHGPQVWLKWTGVAAALCGAIGYLALRGQAASY